MITVFSGTNRKNSRTQLIATYIYEQLKAQTEEEVQLFNLEDLPKNSLLRDNSVFMAMSGSGDAQETEWGSHTYFTFIKLIPQFTVFNNCKSKS